MTERTRLLSYSREASGRKAANEATTRATIPKRGVIFLWSALALVINITLSSLRSMRLEVLSARKNGAREEMERLPERPMKIVTTRFLGVRKFPLG